MGTEPWPVIYTVGGSTVGVVMAAKGQGNIAVALSLPGTCMYAAWLRGRWQCCLDCRGSGTLIHFIIIILLAVAPPLTPYLLPLTKAVSLYKHCMQTFLEEEEV